MARRLSLTTVVVRDYDEAKDFFVRALGMRLIEDTPQPDGKRWVVVRPGEDGGCGLLLARAANPRQSAYIGDQTGGRVALFLETDDFEADRRRMIAAGVRFVESPRHEPYGTVAVFEDLYGNRWDLIQPKD
ncbi:MAG: VOC family protein [Caulobacterales bacterium]